MAEHAKDNTLETAIANLTDEREGGTDAANFSTPEVEFPARC